MKNSFHTVLLIFTFLTFRISGSAQARKGFDILKDSIETMLPPLETIIDSALAKNPYVKFRDLQVTINKYQLKASKADWTKNFGFSTDAMYGTFNNFSTNINPGQVQSPTMLALSTTQLTYGVGAYIRLPFYDLINRKNQNRIARATIEQAQSFSLEQRTELRQLVIKQYNEVITKHRILKIKIRYAETARINMEMAQKQFLNGVISVADYSSISEIVSRSETELENSKMDFRTAYMILEEIVGIKFNLTDQIN